MYPLALLCYPRGKEVRKYPLVLSASAKIWRARCGCSSRSEGRAKAKRLSSIFHVFSGFSTLLQLSAMIGLRRLWQEIVPRKIS